MSIAADVTIKHLAPEPGGQIGRGGLNQDERSGQIDLERPPPSLL